MYKVKEEYIDMWSNDAEWCTNSIVTAKDIADFANGCGVSVDELMEQVEEIDDD